MTNINLLLVSALNFASGVWLGWWIFKKPSKLVEIPDYKFAPEPPERKEPTTKKLTRSDFEIIEGEIDGEEGSVFFLKNLYGNYVGNKVYYKSVEECNIAIARLISGVDGCFLDTRREIKIKKLVDRRDFDIVEYEHGKFLIEKKYKEGSFRLDRPIYKAKPFIPFDSAEECEAEISKIIYNENNFPKIHPPKQDVSSVENSNKEERVLNDFVFKSENNKQQYY